MQYKNLFFKMFPEDVILSVAKKGQIDGLSELGFCQNVAHFGMPALTKIDQCGGAHI